MKIEVLTQMLELIKISNCTNYQFKDYEASISQGKINSNTICVDKNIVLYEVTTG